MRGEGSPDDLVSIALPNGYILIAMWKRFYNRVRFIPPTIWLAGALFLSMNLWFDHYHPSGYVLDVGLLVGLLIAAFKPDDEDAHK